MYLGLTTASKILGVQLHLIVLHGHLGSGGNLSTEGLKF